MRAPVCLSPTGCVRQVAGVFSDRLVDAINGAAGQMLTSLFSWWTKTPPLRLKADYVLQAQEYVTSWVALPVAVLALLAAVAWGVLGGGSAWVADVWRGLLVFGIVAAGSIPIVDALQKWAAALSKGLLGAVPAQDVGSRYLDLLEASGTQLPLAAAFWAFVMFLAACAQYLLMLFRDGAVMVLVAVLPLAAAGQFSRGSALWLPKVAGWLLALIFYKPAAALVYFVGFTMIGKSGDVHGMATAVCVMIAAIVALPSMLGLVSFAASPPSLTSSAPGMASSATGLGVSLAQTRAVQQGAAAAMPAGAPAVAAASGAVAAVGGSAGAPSAGPPGPAGAAAARPVPSSSRRDGAPRP